MPPEGAGATRRHSRHSGHPSHRLGLTGVTGIQRNKGNTARSSGFGETTGFGEGEVALKN